MRVRNRTWRIKTIIAQRDKIELQPVYQRGEAWSLEKRQLLIDSVLRCFDIPKIYLRRLSNNRMYEYQIVDGQQRLTSLWRFTGDSANAFALLSDAATPASWSGKRFSELSATLRRRILDFPVIIAIIEDSGVDEVRELFARLQKGMQLNPAELRNSMRSALGTAVRATAETHPFFRCSPFSEQRYKHHDLCAHAYAIELCDGCDDLKAPNLRTLYIQHADVLPTAVGARVHRALTYMTDMLATERGCISRKWGFVDLYGVLKVHWSKLPNPGVLALRYLKFEAKRMQYVGDPRALLQAKRRDLEMFRYIEAFRLSAGMAKNLQVRREVLAKKLLRGGKERR